MKNLLQQVNRSILLIVALFAAGSLQAQVKNAGTTIGSTIQIGQTNTTEINSINPTNAWGVTQGGGTIQIGNPAAASSAIDPGVMNDATCLRKAHDLYRMYKDGRLDDLHNSGILEEEYGTGRIQTFFPSWVDNSVHQLFNQYELAEFYFAYFNDQDYVAPAFQDQILANVYGQLCAIEKQDDQDRLQELANAVDFEPVFVLLTYNIYSLYSRNWNGIRAQSLTSYYQNGELLGHQANLASNYYEQVFRNPSIQEYYGQVQAILATPEPDIEDLIALQKSRTLFEAHEAGELNGLYQLIANREIDLLFEISGTEPEIRVDDKRRASGPCSADDGYTWVESNAYDGDGNRFLASRQYFDQLGQAVQTQKMNFTENEVVASQMIYDEFNRKAVNTLPAAINRSDFCFKDKFVVDHFGTNYSYHEFDDKVTPANSWGETNNPLPVATGNIGSVNWYYGGENSYEPFTATSTFPYHRTVYSNDPLNEPFRTSIAGEHYSMGGAHESVAKTMPELTELAHYVSLSHHFVPNRSASSLSKKVVKKVTLDQNGLEFVEFFDKANNLIASCQSGQVDGSDVAIQNTVLQMDINEAIVLHVPQGLETYYLTTFQSLNSYLAITDLRTNFTVDPTSLSALPKGFYRIKNVSGQANISFGLKLNYFHFMYHYYDKTGQVVATVHPEGVDLSSTAYPNHVSTYKYDSRGNLLESESADRNLGKVAYRNDSRVRFSQSSEQRNQGKFTYTNYDAIGRAVEVGEYDPNASTNHGIYTTTAAWLDPFAHNLAVTGTDEILIINTSTGDELLLADYPDNLPANILTAGDLVFQSKQPFQVDYDFANPFAGIVHHTKVATIDPAIGDISWFRALDHLDMYLPNGTSANLEVLTANSLVEITDLATTTVVYTGNVSSIPALADGTYRIAADLPGTPVQARLLRYGVDDRLEFQGHAEKGDPLNTAQFSTGAMPVMYRSVLDILEVEDGISDAYCTAQTYFLRDAPDPDFPAASLPDYKQRFCLGRVAKSWNGLETTWYSYDPDGRVSWMVKDIDGIGLKTTNFEYDFIGNVTKISYQREDPSESFFHFYTYDADKRMKEVSTATSEHTACTEKLAEYEYYLHGPLKRSELGEDLQGLDYVYTINGWLKSINNPSLDDNSAFDDLGVAGIVMDPGKDGYSGANSGFAKDVFGFSLDYHNEDYTTPNTYINYHDLTASVSDQFSGNIKSQRWKIKDQDAPAASKEWMYAYEYDHRNRIKSASFGEYKPQIVNMLPGNFIPTPQWDPTFTASADFEVSGVTYDRNGNIMSLNRYGDGTDMDNFAYNYNPNTNQLNSVDDPVASGNYTTDIDGQSANNYLYNDVGQLVADEGKGFEIDYDSYAMTELIRKEAPDYGESGGGSGLMLPYVKYDYSAQGYRIKKTTFAPIENLAPGQSNIIKETWFVRDNMGRILSVYDKDHTLQNSTVAQTEMPLYGSGRIGVKYFGATDVIYKCMTNGGMEMDYRKALATLFELKDHLGNVRAVIKQKKDFSGLAQTESFADYYPFGSQMPGRSLTGSSNYRFGYQGQHAEKDDETGWNAFELRLYEPGLGRWLTPDAMNQHSSPYLAMGNNPISRVDPNGGYDYDVDNVANVHDVPVGSTMHPNGNITDENNNLIGVLSVDGNGNTTANIFNVDAVVITPEERAWWDEYILGTGESIVNGVLYTGTYYANEFWKGAYYLGKHTAHTTYWAATWGDQLYKHSDLMLPESMQVPLVQVYALHGVQTMKHPVQGDPDETNYKRVISGHMTGLSIAAGGPGWIKKPVESLTNTVVKKGAGWLGNETILDSFAH